MLFNEYPYKVEKFYNKYLSEISDIKFTAREIDIISCILHNRREKKIASLLTISHRTVGSHVRNILGKTGYSSRDYIIDFIEKSGKLQYMKQHYAYLIAQSLFKNQLEKIASVVSRSKIYISIFTNNIRDKDKELIEHVKESLSRAGIKTLESCDKKGGLCVSANVKCTTHLHQKCTSKNGH